MVREKLKKKSKLQIAQEKVQERINETNNVISELGEYTGDLYKSLTRIQEKFDIIRNIPSEKKLNSGIPHQSIPLSSLAFLFTSLIISMY